MFEIQKSVSCSAFYLSYGGYFPVILVSAISIFKFQKHPKKLPHSDFLYIKQNLSQAFVTLYQVNIARMRFNTSK